MNGKGYMMTRNQPFYLLALFFLLIGCSIEEMKKNLPVTG